MPRKQWLRLIVIRKWFREFVNYLSRYSAPTDHELVNAVVLGTANLELTKGETVQLAPLKGCCGPFTLSGNSLPVFEYIVFDKTIMEFVRVKVEISRPDRIHYYAFIESLTTDIARHGEVIHVKHKYSEPFERLIQNLFKYFALYKKA